MLGIKNPPTFDKRVNELNEAVSSFESKLHKDISSKIQSIPNKDKDQILNYAQNIIGIEINSTAENIVKHISTITLWGLFELEKQQKLEIERILENFFKKQISETMLRVNTWCASKYIVSRNHEEHYKASILDIQTRIKNNLEPAITTAILINKQRIGTEKEKKAGDRIWQIINIILGIIIGYFLGKYLIL